MTTQRLNQDLIDMGLQCPPAKRRVELCDTAQPGLYVEVRETSTEGTYYLRHKVAGKTRHDKLDRTGEISLADDRKRAQKRRAELHLEKDETKAASATTRPTAMTLDDFFEQKYLTHVKPRKRSWDRDEELFR